MNLFAWLLVGHLVGDFLLQTSWMAERKANNWPALLLHCIVYTSATAMFAQLAGGISLAAIVFIFLGHIILDKRKFVDFWSKHVTRSPDSTWLKIAQDQSWHIVILAVATMLYIHAS